MKKILVTGASGFIGRRLLPSLKRAGHYVSGPALDLYNFESLLSVVQADRWDTIIHLAGISHVPTCDRDPELAYRTNLTGTALLLEAITRHAPSSHLIFASSAQVYAAPEGDEINGVVFEETRKVEPQNTYARTKWLAEIAIREAVNHSRLQATILRIFNHSHKSQSEEFFLPGLHQRLLQAKKGQKIRVGNLDLKRDIGVVDDLVAAITSLLTLDHTPDQNAVTYNVCSGTAKSLRTLAEKLALALRVPVEFEVDPSLVRKQEPYLICGSHKKLTEQTGWLPSATTEAQLITRFLSD